MSPRRVVNDNLGGLELVIIFDEASHLAVPYERRIGDWLLIFTLLQDGRFPFALQDEQTQTV